MRSVGSKGSERKLRLRREAREGRRREARDGHERQAPAGQARDGHERQAPAGQAREQRTRERGPLQDHATYTCGCGYVFEAPVSTTVGCPHCGTRQAW